MKIDLREIEWDGMDWIDQAQDRHQWRALVNKVMNLRVPLNAGNFLSGCTIGSFSRTVQFRKYVRIQISCTASSGHLLWVIL
jgi:hypothetical protein